MASLMTGSFFNAVKGLYDSFAALDPANPLRRAVSAVIVAIGAFLIIKIARRLVNRALKRRSCSRTDKRINTMRKLINSIITYTVVIMAAIQLLQSVFRVNMSAVLAAAGVVGIAIGFGAQALVRDMIAGFFILLEGQFAVGDKVTIAAFTGTVDELGLRSTRLKNPAGDIFIVPNGGILNLINHSLLPRAFFVSGIFPQETDPAGLLQIFNEAGKKAQEDFCLEEAPSASVAPVEEGHSVRLKVTCRPGSADLMGREILHRLAGALAQAQEKTADGNELEIIGSE
ncbi:MAG: mechanosensitive ion channel family protein [Oscillospiraceae bacterium]|nr:mechanosensitive ion channel family protein [Oscillospiraceae bacterium]